MASTITYSNVQGHQFPPSPPPSPPATRLRHRKKVDPFDQAAIDSISSTPPDEAVEQESILRKLIVTPVLFIAFLFSLFLVNFWDRARRHKQHVRRPSSLLTYLYPSSWLDHEPYQDPGDSSWGRTNSTSHVEPHDAISPRGRPKQEPWHLNKKIRKMSKLELSDAFELRGKVIVGMVLAMVLSFAMTYLSLRWTFVQISE